MREILDIMSRTEAPQELSLRLSKEEDPPIVIELAS